MELDGVGMGKVMNKGYGWVWDGDGDGGCGRWDATGMGKGIGWDGMGWDGMGWDGMGCSRNGDGTRTG